MLRKLGEILFERYSLVFLEVEKVSKKGIEKASKKFRKIKGKNLCWIYLFSKDAGLATLIKNWSDFSFFNWSQVFI